MNTSQPCIFSMKKYLYSVHLFVWLCATHKHMYIFTNGIVFGAVRDKQALKHIQQCVPRLSLMAQAYGSLIKRSDDCWMTFNVITVMWIWIFIYVYSKIVVPLWSRLPTKRMIWRSFTSATVINFSMEHPLYRNKSRFRRIDEMIVVGLPCYYYYYYSRRSLIWILDNNSNEKKK